MQVHTPTVDCDGIARGSMPIKRTDGTIAYEATNAATMRDAVTAAVAAGAHLAGADLMGANLTGADLTGADGVLAIGPIDTWIMYAVRFPDGPRIKAGCRWFTVAEAREWWGRGGAAQDTVTHGPRMLAGVDALTALARAHGWEVSQ